MIALPKNFETYPEARKAGFLRMKALKAQGQRVVGVFCSFVPTELIYAAGAIPIGLCAFTEDPSRQPRLICPAIRVRSSRRAMALR